MAHSTLPPLHYLRQQWKAPLNKFLSNQRAPTSLTIHIQLLVSLQFAVWPRLSPHQRIWHALPPSAVSRGRLPSLGPFLPMSSLPPLPSPEGESPSLYRFLCPDKSPPLRSPPRALHEVAFIPCPGSSSVRSPPRGSVLAIYQATLCGGLSHQLPASPYALRSNASGVAVVASQPRQQTQRRRCPWPWQVRHPRPTALPLVRVCQRSRARHPPHRIGVHTRASKPKRVRRYR